MKFVQNPYYLLTVAFLVMPLNGVIATHNPLLGVALMMMQLPNFITYFKKHGEL